MRLFSKIVNVTAVLAIAALASTSASAAERISDFSLVDADGRFFQLSRNTNQEAIVLLSYSVDSRDARRAVSDMEDLAEDFTDQAVKFLLISSTSETDKSVFAEEAEKRGIEFRILVDDTQLVSQSLGFTRIGEAQ